MICSALDDFFVCDGVPFFPCDGLQACVCLFAVTTLNCLFYLLCRWSIDFKLRVFFSRLSAPEAGSYLCFKPAAHRGKPSLALLSRSDRTGALVCDFQKQKYQAKVDFKKSKSLSKRLSLPQPRFQSLSLTTSLSQSLSFKTSLSQSLFQKVSLTQPFSQSPSLSRPLSLSQPLSHTASLTPPPPPFSHLFLLNSSFPHACWSPILWYIYICITPTCLRLQILTADEARMRSDADEFEGLGARLQGTAGGVAAGGVAAGAVAAGGVAAGATGSREWAVAVVSSPVSLPIRSYLSSRGLRSADSVSSAFESYGFNILSVRTPRFIDLYVEQLLSPLVIFQIFVSVLWLLDAVSIGFTAFQIFMILMLESTSVFQRHFEFCGVFDFSTQTHPFLPYVAHPFSPYLRM